MDSNAPLDEQLEAEPEVMRAVYDAETNLLHVFHKEPEFSELEVKSIRQGKLTPSKQSGQNCIHYEVHITLDEQRQARASKFSFSA